MSVKILGDLCIHFKSLKNLGPTETPLCQRLLELFVIELKVSLIGECPMFPRCCHELYNKVASLVTFIFSKILAEEKCLVLLCVM